MQANKLGWVTSISINNSYDSTISADLSIVADGNPRALMSAFNKWMKGGINMPVFEEEYMCLYCTSPNGVENTHCKKCGAPRSFVIG